MASGRRRYRPHPGRQCEIARWRITGEGWRASTVRGIYLGEDKNRIYVRVDGVKFAFDRPAWEHVIN